MATWVKVVLVLVFLMFAHFVNLLYSSCRAKHFTAFHITVPSSAFTMDFCFIKLQHNTFNVVPIKALRSFFHVLPSVLRTENNLSDFLFDEVLPNCV